MASCGVAARVFGLWHGELHGGNFRIKLTDPTALYLRDFGRTRVDEAKQRQDIENLCLRVRFPNQNGDECLEALCVAVETIARMRGIKQAAIDHFAQKINQLKQSLTTRNATVLARSIRRSLGSRNTAPVV
jgi:hypothetical protein